MKNPLSTRYSNLTDDKDVEPKTDDLDHEMEAEIIPTHFLPPDVASRLESDLRSQCSAGTTEEEGWATRLSFVSKVNSLGGALESTGEEGGGPTEHTTILSEAASLCLAAVKSEAEESERE